MRDHRDSHNFFFFGGGRDTAWHVGSNLCPLHRKAVLTNGLLGKSPFHTYILECQVKWALRSTAVNKASGCDEIPAKLFRSLKDDAVKVLHSLCQQIWKTQKWPQDWKRSILIPIPKKHSTKECVNHQIIALISCASKVMLKILHAMLQHYVNQELPDVQAGFQKEGDIEIKLPTFAGL